MKCNQNENLIVIGVFFNYFKIVFIKNKNY